MSVWKQFLSSLTLKFVIYPVFDLLVYVTYFKDVILLRLIQRIIIRFHARHLFALLGNPVNRFRLPTSPYTNNKCALFPDVFNIKMVYTWLVNIKSERGLLKVSLLKILQITQYCNSKTESFYVNVRNFFYIVSRVCYEQSETPKCVQLLAYFWKVLQSEI